MGGYATTTLAQLAASISDAESIVGLDPAPSTTGEMAVWDGTKWASTVRAMSIGTTDVIGAMMRNTTASTGPVTEQYSPMLVLGGSAWDTTPSGASQDMDWALQVQTTSAAAASSKLSFERRIDGSAWSQMMSISSSGIMTLAAISATSYIYSAGLFVDGAVDTDTGLGNCGTIYQGTNRPIALMVTSSDRDVADGVCVASVFRREAAITNAATVRVHSFGVNLDTVPNYTELAAVFADGHMVVSNNIHLAVRNTASKGAAGTAGRVFYCSDGDTGDPCLAVDDGTNWLRVVLGAAIASS